MAAAQQTATLPTTATGYNWSTSRRVYSPMSNASLPTSASIYTVSMPPTYTALSEYINNWKALIESKPAARNVFQFAVLNCTRT